MGGSRKELISQQTSDPTLTKLIMEVGRSRSPYFVNPSNGLTFRKTSIGGLETDQLLLLESRKRR